MSATAMLAGLTLAITQTLARTPAVAVFAVAVLLFAAGLVSYGEHIDPPAAPARTTTASHVPHDTGCPGSRAPATCR